MIDKCNIDLRHWVYGCPLREEEMAHNWKGSMVFVIFWDLFNGTCSTLHSKIKKLSTNSPIDFNSVLDTINHYWIDPAK